jgi:hypothetical protein
MSKWLVRGLVFAALMVVVRLIQGALINAFETKALIISIALLAVYVVVVFVWGLFDGRTDARANPDPDRRFDLAMTWLVAGLIAGIVGGAVSWLISVFYKGLYTGGLISEVTTFAAFTALLVFVPAIIAVAIGRWLIDRNAAPVSRKGNAYEDGRADTDVFEAVRDDSPTGAIPVAHEYDIDHETEKQTSSVATAERSDETTALEDERKDQNKD